MRFATMARGNTVAEIVANAEANRRAGYSSVWFSEGVGMDPLTLIAAVGHAVPEIELGTAVVRTLPRHPMALAQQALTTSSLIPGRLVLGVGPSHRRAMEDGWGIAFARPLAHTRDYLSILTSLLEGGSVSYDGEMISAHGELHIADPGRVQVLVGALGPRMLALAGSLAGGTVTMMAGPRTLSSYVCPTVRQAAAMSGSPPPRVVAMLAVCVTDDVTVAAQRFDAVMGPMATLPSYASLIEREGGPAIIAGSEQQVIDSIHALEAAGVTDLVPLRVAKRGTDEAERTEALLLQLVAGGG